jgi:hypothetical protein
VRTDRKWTHELIFTTAVVEMKIAIVSSCQGSNVIRHIVKSLALKVVSPRTRTFAHVKFGCERFLVADDAGTPGPARLDLKELDDFNNAHYPA